MNRITKKIIFGVIGILTLSFLLHLVIETRFRMHNRLEIKKIINMLIYLIGFFLSYYMIKKWRNRENLNEWEY